MNDRKPPSWIEPLPKQDRPDIKHRYAIAGATASSAAKTTAPTAADHLGLVSERHRATMVERIAARGVNDAAVLAAMRAVPRHIFVEPGLASRSYDDTALPIKHQQTISQPYIVARMIELMINGKTTPKGKPLKRVLEIGTGCGYQAAVLGQVAECVYTIERIKALHELARLNLRPLRLANVRLHFGDGRIGLAHEGPFDGIILAAAGLGIPEALLDQLAMGGRLIGPVETTGGGQRLMIVDRIGAAHWKSTPMDTVNFVPLCSGTT